MKVIIFGGSGFIGKHLTSYFTKKGYEVVLVSRSQRQVGEPRVRNVTWNDLEQSVASLEDAYAFVNLSGETINQYWSPKAKEKILDSRIGTTKQVAEMVQRVKTKPKVVINGSAIGVYGMSESNVFDEVNPTSSDDFLSRIVNEWENVANMIEPYARLVKLRLGVVLDKDGGALPKMLVPYKLFIGGRVGTGKQWISWIHVKDLVKLIDFCIENENIEGPINATAPNPATNDELGRAIAKVLHRPYILTAPALIIQLIFGEMSQILLKGQKVIPKKALEHGFNFAFPTIEEAVKDLLG